VTNHGIPEAAIDAAVDAAKRFFALPETEKLKVRTARSPPLPHVD
jgi:isopenicillin N synthase-like dioxygenase